LRVVRIYHAGRAAAHRARERALTAAGVRLTLIVPAAWHEGGGEDRLSEEPFEIVELPAVRPGDVNRHRYADETALKDVIASRRPDLVDIHEEPFSAVTRQTLSVVPDEVPVVMYTAQNVDKRYPPPFTGWERSAYQRATGIYPCSRQAASVARGRGFGGIVRVLPLGFDPALFQPGAQRHDDDVWQLAIASRLVPEKGVRDCVRTLAEVSRHRRALLVLAGDGPEADRIAPYASEFGVPLEWVEHRRWLPASGVADLYRSSHVVLAPSSATSRWVEQFGRMIPEAQASGAVVAGYASGAIPEVAGGGAWLAAEGDEVGLGRAAAHLARDAAVWERYRAAGRHAAADKTWAAVAKAQAAFYDECLAAGPQRERLVTPDRSAASREFGEPARLTGDVRRPIAVPLLRELPRLARTVDRLTRRS
jgi:glycosyltransferase involved in cell wall biosynthesis